MRLKYQKQEALTEQDYDVAQDVDVKLQRFFDIKEKLAFLE